VKGTARAQVQDSGRWTVRACWQDSERVMRGMARARERAKAW